MSRTLIALFEDYDAAMAECKRLLGDGPAQMGRWLTEHVLNVLLEDERDEQCRAACYERTPERRDWRNGFYGRTLRTKMGPLELRVPRARSGGLRSKLLPRFRQVAPELDEGIGQLYRKGVSTRSVGPLLEVLFGARVSASTVSRVTRALDAQIKRFAQRRLEDRYRCLVLDGVYLSVKKAQGADRRPLLVAYGIDENNRREVIDFRVAPNESEAAWTALLTSLEMRGLTGERLELIVTDGAPGLIRAIETVYPLAARQRCWVHMMRNVVSACPKRLAGEVAEAARQIYLASTRRAAIAKFKALKRRYGCLVPRAVAKIEHALDELLAFFTCEPGVRRAFRTTNGIERLFVELRRRQRPIGCLPDAAAARRLAYVVFDTYNARRHRLRPDKETQTALAA
jgi:transposase-like protein